MSEIDYEARARAVLGDELFESCVRAAEQAPEPTATQIETIARIFGPPLRRLAREAQAKTKELAA